MKSVLETSPEWTASERGFHMKLDLAHLERALVHHCAPTLAGMKPGCLFNIPGPFAVDTHEEPAARLSAWRHTREQCMTLDALVAREQERLRTSGIIVRVLAHRCCGALVYVYRPSMLTRSLTTHAVSTQLLEWGYHLDTPTWLDASLEQLGSKLEQCHRCNFQAHFPHEIGFFLGYPYADVMGFIEHEGKDYLCCGPWKVYSEQARAEACFERYRDCTHAYELLFDMGASICDLALIRVAGAA